MTEPTFAVRQEAAVVGVLLHHEGVIDRDALVPEFGDGELRRDGVYLFCGNSPGL